MAKPDKQYITAAQFMYIARITVEIMRSAAEYNWIMIFRRADAPHSIDYRFEASEMFMHMEPPDAVLFHRLLFARMGYEQRKREPEHQHLDDLAASSMMETFLGPELWKDFTERYVIVLQ
jgi:hypothetical protein